MPVQLLPASAAAFAPRASSVNVVLGSKVEPWLTKTLKRVNKIKRPLNSVPQHQRCLTDILSSKTALWTLSSLMLTKKEDECRQDANPLVEAMYNYHLVHIEAYIVHVDMVLRNEVAFKLTPDTIAALIAQHKDVHCVDMTRDAASWPEKDATILKMHDDFIQAVNKYVFRTHVSVLEGLEEDGVGEFLAAKSEEVKANLMLLFHPLPTPRPATVLQSSPSPSSSWWTQPCIPSASPSPVDPWRVVPSSSPQTSTATASPDTQTLWPSLFSDVHVSPQPAYVEPFSTAGFFYSAPTITAPIPTLPLPSMLTSQCGMGMGYGGFGNGFGGFGWDRMHDNYATTM